MAAPLQPLVGFSAPDALLEVEALTQKDGALVAELFELLLHARVVLDLLLGVAVAEDRLVRQHRLLHLRQATLQEPVVSRQAVLLHPQRLGVPGLGGSSLGSCCRRLHLDLHVQEPLVELRLAISLTDVRLQ